MGAAGARIPSIGRRECRPGDVWRHDAALGSAAPVAAVTGRTGNRRCRYPHIARANQGIWRRCSDLPGEEQCATRCPPVETDRSSPGRLDQAAWMRPRVERLQHELRRAASRCSMFGRYVLPRVDKCKWTLSWPRHIGPQKVPKRSRRGCCAIRACARSPPWSGMPDRKLTMPSLRCSCRAEVSSSSETRKTVRWLASGSPIKCQPAHTPVSSPMTFW